jgi:hypothetical protein
MAQWNTKQIMADLRTIIPVTAIDNTGGEDSSTDNLVLMLGGVEDKLFIKGFIPEKFWIDTTDDIDVSHVELTDGLSGRGGLNSHDFRLARAYIDVRQYFINRGFDVVPRMSEYF